MGRAVVIVAELLTLHGYRFCCVAMILANAALAAALLADAVRS